MKVEGKSIADQGNGKCKGPIGEEELRMFEDQEGHYG